MSINIRLAQSITRLWEGRLNTYAIKYAINGRSYELGLFRKYISCDIEGPQIIVPVILKPYIENIITKLDRTTNRDSITARLRTEVVHPIIIDSTIIHKRTADSIIKLFFENDTEYRTMWSVVTNKGAKYFGGNGIILDEEGRVLLLAVQVGKYYYENGMIRLKYTENRIYIHPKVMLDDSDLICKGIVKKIIPYMLEAKIVPRHYSNIYVDNNIKNTVIVEDVSSMITTPMEIPLNFSDEHMNSFLQERADDIINASNL